MQRLAQGLQYALVLLICISGSGDGRVGQKGQLPGQQKLSQEVTRGHVPMRASGEKDQMYLEVSRAVGWGWHCPGASSRTPVTYRQVIPEAPRVGAPLGTNLASTPTDGPSWLPETPFLALHVDSTSTLLMSTLYPLASWSSGISAHRESNSFSFGKRDGRVVR